MPSGYLSAQDLHKANLSRVAPCLVWMSILAVVGLVGNLLVLIVFQIRYPKGNFRNFVLCLSAIDTLSCLITIPGEVYIQYEWFVFEVSWICSLKSYFNDFTVYSSAVTLLLISVDRFFKTCKPFQKQFTPDLALKINIGAICVFSLLAIPRGIFWGKHTYNLTEGNTTFSVSTCEKGDDFKNSTLPSYYTKGVYVPVNVIMMGANVILYCIIGRKIVSVNKQMIIYRLSRRNKKRPKPSQDTAEISEHNPDTLANSDGYPEADNNRRVTTITPTSSHVIRTVSGTSSSSDRCLLQANSTNMSKEQLLKALTKLTQSELKVKKKKRPMTHSSRKTLTVFIMVLVYVITTTVYLSLLSVISGTDNFLQTLTITEKTVSLFFFRLYFINSVINPILYGVMDHRFSSFLKNSGRRIISSFRVAASPSIPDQP
ncbi:hypothetical protein ACJMK2_044081 [Sinanodonta woodiana]|uniref:G-protein coupled receptors family 1 profile domain-containing protein n=1 Tax=Sinanodonta woodiana TaxID=1069815 RepID=A0ABD3W282_SINWO